MSTRADEALRQAEQTTRRKAAARRSTGFWQATMDGAHFRVVGVGSRSGAYLTVEDCLTRLSLRSAPPRSQCCLGRRQSGFGFLVRLINQGVASYRWVGLRNGTTKFGGFAGMKINHRLLRLANEPREK
jgi:hypothetical protein